MAVGVELGAHQLRSPSSCRAPPAHAAMPPLLDSLRQADAPYPLQRRIWSFVAQPWQQQLGRATGRCLRGMKLRCQRRVGDGDHQRLGLLQLCVVINKLGTSHTLDADLSTSRALGDTFVYAEDEVFETIQYGLCSSLDVFAQRENHGADTTLRLRLVASAEVECSVAPRHTARTRDRSFLCMVCGPPATQASRAARSSPKVFDSASCAAPSAASAAGRAPTSPQWISQRRPCLRHCVRAIWCTHVSIHVYVYTKDVLSLVLSLQCSARTSRWLGSASAIYHPFLRGTQSSASWHPKSI